jgi:hypothetical protein
MPIQRPQTPARQKKHFSGKRGFHTVKNTTVADTDKRILILGETVPGSQHDDSLFKEEFDPRVDWFSSTEASVDLGYQGIQTDYSSSEHLQVVPLNFRDESRANWGITFPGGVALASKEAIPGTTRVHGLSTGDR